MTDERMRALAALARAAARFPQMRLLQIVMNALNMSEDPFHVTDVELAQDLEAYIRKVGR